jgi:hypothetical protein
LWNLYRQQQLSPKWNWRNNNKSSIITNKCSFVFLSHFYK